MGDVAKRSGRPDLARRLGQTQRRQAEPGVRVLVVGEFKQGKSLLVNAIVNAPVCPVDDDIATAIPTVVMYGEQPSASLVYLKPDTAPPGGDTSRPDAWAGEGDLERRDVPINELADHISESGNAPDDLLAFAEVKLPRELLRGGLQLVDTPGVGGLGSGHSATTMTVLPTADVVLLVSDAGQEFTAPEIDFFRQALKLCPNVACMLTKIDLYPEWRRIVEVNRKHLAEAGLRVPIYTVSSTLRLHAAAAKDAALNGESGFPPVIQYLRHDVLGRADLLARRSATHDVLYVLDHLSVAVQGELTALKSPENSAALVRELEKARSLAEALKRRSARWQQALNDGVADLTADIDYDLRDRTRAIIREAEELLNASDPGRVWDQFVEWLQQEVDTMVGDNFVWAHERSQWLAEEISRFFVEEGGHQLPEMQVDDTVGVLDPVPLLQVPDDERVGVASKMLIGMRGSYGGVLMFGLLTGVMGLSLINPISIGAGIIIGTKAYRDDKQAKVRKRRAEAKVAVRRHIDDVILHVGKESKDRLRGVQRVLRDHFTELAEEMTASLNTAVSAAQRATQIKSGDRDKRIQELTAELSRLEKFRAQAKSLQEVAPPAVRTAA